MPVKNHLALFSAMVGVMSIAFTLMGMSLPLGALGVIMACLSRGNYPMEKPAKVGLALSMFGITIGICMYIWTYFLLQSPEFSTMLEQYMNLYGM